MFINRSEIRVQLDSNNNRKILDTIQFITILTPVFYFKIFENVSIINRHKIYPLSKKVDILLTNIIPTDR